MLDARTRAPIPPKPDPAPPLWARVARQAQRLDWPLLLLTVLMVLGGLVVVYSASVPFALSRTDKDPYFFLKRHVLFVALGMVGMLSLAFWDYRKLLRPRWLLPPTLGGLVLLLVLDVRNLVTGEHMRTLLPRGSIQPGEWIKPLLVVYLAAWLTRKRRQFTSPWQLWVHGGTVIGIVVLLLILQPDLSAAGTAGLLGVFMLLLAGMRTVQVLLALAAAGLAAFLGLRVAMWMYPPAAERLSTYIIAWKDPTQVPGHMRQAFFAFIRGGWFGLGPGEARGKIYALPLPHTDSVYAVIGEEWGTVGALVVLLLFVLFLWRGLYLAGRSRDPFARLLLAGMTLWIVLEAFIHMGGMVGLIPQAGNSLPFFSYGGSNLVAALSAVGLMLSAARGGSEPETEVVPHAVVDLRGRDRGRRVPGPGRVPTAP